MRVAEREEGLGVGRIGGQGPLQGAYSVLRLAQPQIGGSGVEESLDVGGLAGEHAGEGRQSFGRSVRAQVDRSERDARFVGIGLLDQAGAGVALGRLEVAELEGRAHPLEMGGLALLLRTAHLAVLEGRAAVSGEKSPARDSARASAAPASPTRAPGNPASGSGAPS